MNKVFSFLFKDFQWKLLSLALAFILWLAGMNASDPTQNKPYAPALKFYNMELLESNNIRVLNAKSLSSQPVTVNIRAMRSVHTELENNPSQVEASIDFSDVIVSEVLASDKPVFQQLSVNADVGLGGEYMSVKPKTVTVHLDKYVSQPFDVNIVEQGEIDPQHELIETRSSIQTVTVSAAKSYVDQVYEVRALADLTGAEESFSKPTGLIAYDREGRDITDTVELSFTETTIYATILPQKEVRLYIDHTGSLMYNHVVTETIVTPETVLIVGLPEVLEEINEIELAPLDLTNHNQTYNTSVNINDSLPSNIRLKTGQPAEAAVIYTIEPLRTQEFLVPSENIRIAGYSDLAVRLSTDTVSITVQGPDSHMDGMTEARVSASLNVFDLGVGAHSVPLNVTLPAGMTTVGTPVVDIVITEEQEERPGADVIWEVTLNDDGTPVFINMATRAQYYGPRNPETGLPPNGVVLDPLTGLLVSGIDPETGALINMVDPIDPVEPAPGDEPDGADGVNGDNPLGDDINGDDINGDNPLGDNPPDEDGQIGGFLSGANSGASTDGSTDGSTEPEGDN